LYASAGSWNLTNSGVGSADSTDAFDNIYSKTSITVNDRSAWLAGYNDMRYYDSNSDMLNTFKDNIYAGSVWLATLSADKKTGQGGGTTESGTWSNSDIFTALGRKSSTQNDYVEFTASGTVIYVGYTKLVTGTGQFELFVDTVSKGTFNCYGAKTSASGNTYSAALARVTGLSSGSHTVKVKVVSASGTVYFDWGVGNANTGPEVRIGACLYMNSTGYSSYSPYNNGNNYAVENFRGQAFLAVEDLKDDGLSIQTIASNYYYNVSTDIDADNVHPNDSGHDHIADAFIEDIEDNPPFPSESPSVSVSVSPSGSPSVSESASPSISPSMSESASPSISPSVSESVSPSISPSVSESVSPSISPSASISGSASPSISPSISPSGSQSISPSISPSASPSASPSGEIVEWHLNRNLFIEKVVNGFAMQFRPLTMTTWSDDTRPSNPKRGEFGFNVYTDSFEIFDGVAWFKILLTEV
jgi:hypothetical protein